MFSRASANAHLGVPTATATRYLAGPPTGAALLQQRSSPAKPAVERRRFTASHSSCGPCATLEERVITPPLQSFAEAVQTGFLLERTEVSKVYRHKLELLEPRALRAPSSRNAHV